MLDPALLCRPECAQRPLLQHAHCFAEGVQPCPPLLASSVQGDSCCSTRTALLKVSSPALLCWPALCKATPAAASALLC